MRDFKGQALIDGVIGLVRQHRPVHVSLVGGEPLVRFRELDVLLPRLSQMGLHMQVVTSAVRPIPVEWASIPRLSIVVSIDGLQPEHDVRRAPATYDRILKHIVGHQIVVHCTVTRQLLGREGYLREFTEFWSAAARPEDLVQPAPQVGEESAEKLRPEDRTRVVTDLLALRTEFPKLEMPKGMIEVRDAAIVARRLHLLARDPHAVGRPADEDHALPVRRHPRLLELRLHCLGGAGCHRAASAVWVCPDRSDLRGIVPRGTRGAPPNGPEHAPRPATLPEAGV